jgi:hypothetical protein
VDHKRIYAIIATLLILFVGGNFLASYYALADDSNDSGFWSDWCYISAYPEDRPVCFSSQEECVKAETSDLFKADNCFEHKP